MEYKLMLGDTQISYQLIYKKVKHIILHIRPDGTVWVSANRSHSRAAVEEFLRSQEDWIKKRLARLSENILATPAPVYSPEELYDLVHRLCEEVYPYYRNRGISYPQIKFRKMTSQWGNCRSGRGILTFNTHLRYAPYECIRYVVWHEWTHFLVSGHSREFYRELEAVCPDWKTLKNRLKEVRFV